jgi:uncharacterized protein (DUF362 family)
MSLHQSDFVSGKGIESRVAVARLAAKYPEIAPYHPSRPYPELRGRIPVGGEPNSVYEGVRESLALLGLDRANWGTANWNPLSALIRPGNRVLLKPNLIRASHAYKEDEWEQILTHGSIIRAVLDYVFLALDGKGSITIADGPQTDSDFPAIVARLGLREICDFYRSQFSFSVELLDLRNEHWIERQGIIVGREKHAPDPNRTTLVDLAEHSMFAGVRRSQPLYGAFYDIEETNRSHSGGRHIYAFSRKALESDVVVNLPKLKTHKKTGVTISLKNLVGLNTNKNLLPHYTFGCPESGGDQYADSGLTHKVENGLVVRMKQLLLKHNPVAQSVAKKAKKIGYKIFGDTENVVRSGNWYGNDTVWRMVLDLNRILFYAEASGGVAAERRRRYISIVDAVIAGDGNGPVAARPFPAGMIIAGTNPAAVDATSARLMGFDWRKIPIIAQAFEDHSLPLIDFDWDAIEIASSDLGLTREALDAGLLVHQFQPHFGWTGHIEWQPNSLAVAG